MLHALYFLLLLCITALPAAAQEASTCSPSPLGQPCSQSGLAIASGAEPSLNLGADNPIHIATGNKYQQETDLPANPSAAGIEIVRHYNSQDRRTSALGPGWNLSYDTRLFQVGRRWQIVQADGSRISFSGPGKQPLANRHGVLKPDGEYWLWNWPNGRQLWFDADGYLLRLVASPEFRLDIRRHQQPGPLKGMISSVHNGHGHSLRFNYVVINGRAYLDYADSAWGRFHYQYESVDTAAPSGAQRLASMTRPDGMQRRYLYEAELQAGNATALTGMAIVSADQQHSLRTNTWAYDKHGRAVLSVRGDLDSQADAVSIVYARPATPQKDGLTLVTDRHQRQTRFITAIRGGKYVLTQVAGAGCLGCAAPGSQASYDEHGRLLDINGTQIQRNDSGAIIGLQALVTGWPQLSFNYRADGRRTAWSSTATGTEHISYNTQSLPARRLWANGDSVSYEYDTQKRPIRLVEKNAHHTQESGMQWRGGLLTRIHHPNETEIRQYDQQGRLAQRKIERISAHSDTRLRYTESFEYDDKHRLTTHHLPEGGSLDYRWDKHGRLTAIHWRDAQGQRHIVINSTAGQNGYCHGNGLCMNTALDHQGQARRLTLAQGLHPLWTQHQGYDNQGRMQYETHAIPAYEHGVSYRYVYDDSSRLIAAQGDVLPTSTIPNSNDTLWYAWNDDGSLAASRKGNTTYRPAPRRDASGLPLALDENDVTYGPNRRLVKVQRQGKILASYTHNAFGHRISKRSAQASTNYFYLHNQLLAEGRKTALAAGSQPGISRRYIYAGLVPVGLIDYPALPSDSAQLYAVHADLIGAPRLVTDVNQKIRWLASYSPTGAATQLAGDLTLDLRLPGQVFDAETGWHDNLLRTYLPQSGQYLEPDPLGPVPGNQALGYANQQPRRYADPLGLLLFAFDGTRNSPDTRSNIWKMSQTYRDGPVFYHSGPGNSLYTNWDAIAAWQAGRIVENQWRSLLNALEQSGSLTSHLPIDIIGYSRGAALARHFGNLVSQHVEQGLFSYNDRLRGLITACVDLRFMGLFDTVAQFGIAGSDNANYDLTIAPAWEWVAHAVALHERRWLFPLVSAADTQGNNIIEAPFIGAHADIGGGVLQDDAGQAFPAGDLADVALNWMLWQARAASLRFNNGPASDHEISNPVLHDERSTLLRSIQDGDRSIQTGAGTLLHNYQHEHEKLGGRQRAETEKLIQRPDDWRSSAGADVGLVDMSGYAEWLQNELGWRV
ncbi:DUF2235 domain-containing protein [Alcaligenaceae bacterium]|nr:DUF2235 domain-containing protein [Alcaligenaceae bacterium]